MENIEIREAERKAIQHQMQSENRFVRFLVKFFDIFFIIVASLALLMVAYLTVVTIVTR